MLEGSSINDHEDHKQSEGGLGNELNELGDFDNSRRNSFVGGHNFNMDRRGTIGVGLN